MRQRGAGEKRLAGFWELPEARFLPAAETPREAGRVPPFHHAPRLSDRGLRTAPVKAPKGFHWIAADELPRLPLATTARKALAVVATRPETPA